MIRADVRAAWRFFRDLRRWRRDRLAGHLWVRVDVRPGMPATVQARRHIAHGGPVGGPRSVVLECGERVEPVGKEVA